MKDVFLLDMVTLIFSHLSAVLSSSSTVLVCRPVQDPVVAAKTLHWLLHWSLNWCTALVSTLVIKLVTVKMF